MSKFPRLTGLLAGLLSWGLLTSASSADEIGSYKDKLFAYPGVLSEENAGDFVTVDYDKMRDIHKRDEILELRVKPQYVSLGVRWKQSFDTIESMGRSVDVFRIGKSKGARFAIIFVHGRNGDRKLGANDYTFGGNFNRLKNIAVDNSGLYFAPTAKDFAEEGTADTIALIDYVHRTSPGAKVILSCASMGTFICWKIADDANAVGQLSGMMILGGPPRADFSKTPAYAAKLPLYMGHGTLDTVYKYEDQLAFYKSLVEDKYPARFVLFNTGSHGTPIRMTDWRLTLNWFLK